MLVWILATILGALLFYYFIVKRYDYWRNKGVKQRNTAWVFGENWRMILRTESFAEMNKRIYDQFPDDRYSGMYQFLSPSLIVRDPDLIKQLSVKDFDNFVDHTTFIPESADPLWGKNLISLKGQKWRDMRSILTPSFTSSKMKAMFALMSECAENFVQHFLKRNEDVITLEFKDTFTRFTNDVIATTAFGIQVDSLNEPNNEFYLMGKEATDLSGFWNITKLFGFLVFPEIFSFLGVTLFSKEVSSFFRKIMGDTIKLREEKNIIRPDMINLLLEARKGLDQQEENVLIDTGFLTAQESNSIKPTKQSRNISDTDITAQAMIFFFGGFDSVSTLMCFVAYELAINPDVQEKLKQEIQSTVQQCGGKLTYDVLLKMKYMDMVISEALRKWSFASGTDRICTKPYTIQPTKPGEKPVHIEAGVGIWFPIYGIHHDPKYYPNPERFDPERFSDENKGSIKPYTYLPFGLGPRNCIGSRFALMETKIVIFHILQHFDFVPVGKSKIPLVICKKQLNLMSEGGFWFGLKRVQV